MQRYWSPDEASTFARKCRDLLAESFRAHDEHVSQAGLSPALLTGVEEIRLEGVYPDTTVVVTGKTRAGGHFTDRLPIWGRDSWFLGESESLEKNVDDIRIRYVEAGAASPEDK